MYSVLINRHKIVKLNELLINIFNFKVERVLAHSSLIHSIHFNFIKPTQFYFY